jgi:hypothetical protein
MIKSAKIPIHLFNHQLLFAGKTASPFHNVFKFLLVPYLLDFQTFLRPCPQLLDQPEIDGDLFRKIRQEDISQASDPMLYETRVKYI